MRSNSRRGVASARNGSFPKIRAAIRPLVDALERRLLLSGTLPSFVQPSTDANYTLDNSSGSMVMDLNSGSMVVNADLSTATGWSNATVRLHNSARIYFNSAQTLEDLELHNFSSAAVALGSTATSGNLLQLSGLSIDTWSKLDLGDNSMILHYTPPQEAADNSMIFGLLANGYASSNWNRHGIYSSAAANDPSQKTALGFADNNVLQDSSFAGVSLTDDNEILIRDTLYGDSNLDGAVADSPADDPQFQEGTNGLGTGRSFGDYNYDSITAGSADVSLFAANANQSISQPQYKPSLQVQPLSFTAYQYTPWSGDVATFSDSASRSSYSASDYTATINWGGFVEDAQITQPSAGADYFRVNAQTPTLSNGPFTIQISFAAGSSYTGSPTTAVGMITALRLPSGAVPTSDASYTVSGSPGAVSLNVTAGTIAFNTNVANAGNYWQNLTINASGSAHLIFNSAQTLDALNLSDGAIVTISQGSSGTPGNLLQLDSLSVTSTATLDLGDNSMILYYAPADESNDTSVIQSLLAHGYNSGAWNGTGIDSSAAANDPSHYTALGFLDNNQLLHSQFAGVNLPDFNQILVRYTIYADADLSGALNALDVNLFVHGKNGAGSGWEFGDFNYDGHTDLADQNILINQESFPSLAAQYLPAFQLSLLTVQPFWNASYIGDIATFTDTLNPNLPAGDYTADVYWGTGDLTVAQVYATNTPGQFRINTYSPTLTGANSIMMVTVQYADGSGQQGEPAIASEPIYVLQLPPGVNASADAVYSLGGSPGQIGLSLTAGSLTFDTNVSQNDGNYWQNSDFNISGSAHAYFNAPENFDNLQLFDNATVSVSKGSGGAAGNLLNVQQLSIAPTATLDLSDNALIDWYAFGIDPSSSTGATVESEAAAQMSDWLRSGYNGGAWNGPGIDSSVAADDTTHATALGWMDNGFDYVSVGTDPVDPSVSSFHGVSLPTKDQLLVDFTYKGDANLNGQVDTTDDQLLGIGLNHQGSGWVYGDFNYDSSINSTDSNIWQANYGISANMANVPRTFQPAGIIINPVEGVPLSQDIATFTDLLNPSNTDPSIYQALVNWGDGSFVSAQVTATDTPGAFRINAVSPPLTDPNAVMTVTIQYADMNDPSPTYQGRPAAVSEPLTMTPAVANFTATGVSASEIDLTWTLSASGALAIEVDRSTDGNDWETVTDSLEGNATSYADTSGLSEATHYFYRVSLIWPSGPSAFTNTGDAWTLPSAPSALSVSSSGTNEIDLSWTNNSSVATQFQIERSDDGTNFYTLDTTTGTTYSDTFADDGSTYWYRAEALNDNGDLSAPSGAVSTSTPLASPSELTATAVSASEIDLAWSDDSVTATGYEVDRSTDGTDFTPLASNLQADTSSYSDTGLAAGSHFYYRVISLAGAQFSNPSNTADDTTTPPSPDSAWAGTATSSSVTVNWDPAQGATGYEVDRSVNSGWIDVGDITDGSATSFTDTGLLENTGFSYQIIAKNNAGESSPTGVSATTSLEVPAIPSGVQAIALSATSVEIVWENNADNEQGFNIGYNTNGTSVYTPIGSTAAGTTKFTATNLSPSTAYFFAVQASNSQVTSGWSDPSWLTTPSLPTGSHQPPQAPTNLSATSGTNLIQLQWDPSPTPNVKYWVERQMPGGNNWGVIGLTYDTTYNDDPGVTGFTFSYRVVAANGEHTSDPTNTAQAMKTWPAPMLNLHLFTWSTAYKATVFWDPPVDPNSVDGYSFSYTTSDGTNTISLGAGDHAVTIAAPQGDHTYSYTLVVSKKGAPSTTYSGEGTTVNNPSGPEVTSVSVDSQGILSVSPSTVSLEYTDDPTLTNWLGVLGGQGSHIPLGMTLWVRSSTTEGTVLPLGDPSLPKLGGFNEGTIGGSISDAELYYQWGALASGAGAQVELSMDGKNFFDFGTAGNQINYDVTVSGPAFEGGTFIARVRQYQNYGTNAPTGYSEWQNFDAIDAMPDPPLEVTATGGAGVAHLLWAEGSEGESSQIIECSTSKYFTTIASSVTVGPDTTTYDYGSLAPGTYYFRIKETNGSANTLPMGADSPWTNGSDGANVTTANVSISSVDDAAELGPDNHPQDGYFEVSRTGSTDASLTGQRRPLGHRDGWHPIHHRCGRELAAPRDHSRRRISDVFRSRAAAGWAG